MVRYYCEDGFATTLSICIDDRVSEGLVVDGKFVSSRRVVRGQILGRGDSNEYLSCRECAVMDDVPMNPKPKAAAFKVDVNKIE